jgi:hypothetical protein
MLDLQHVENFSIESSKTMLQQLRQLKEEGGLVIAYSFVVSLGFITFNYPVFKKFENRPSSLRRSLQGFKWALMSFTLGWWGIPWGIIYTPISILVNLAGGHDVTDEFIQKFSNKIHQHEIESSFN